MVAGYLYSKEGQQEFDKLQQRYPKSLQDELYDEWIENTDTSRLKEYSRHKPIEVSQIKRVQTGGGDEYLVYSAIEYRLDKALNLTHRWRPLIGKYPIPQVEYSIQRLDFGKEERQFKEIVNMESGYSIPYTKQNVDKIRDLGTPFSGKQAYAVENAAGLRVAVPRYEDFRNGVFEELFHFSRIPTERQRQDWLEKEGGIEADERRALERKMQIDTRDVPAKTPDINEVRSMIEDAVVKAKKTTEEEEEEENKQQQQQDKGRPKQKK